MNDETGAGAPEAQAADTAAPPADGQPGNAQADPVAAAPEPEAESDVRLPKVGDVVLYRVLEQDEPNLRHNAPVILPAIITAVWGPAYVNLKVITDGPSNVWKSSVCRGDDPGGWNFRD